MNQPRAKSETVYLEQRKDVTHDSPQRPVVQEQHGDGGRQHEAGQHQVAESEDQQQAVSGVRQRPPQQTQHLCSSIVCVSKVWITKSDHQKLDNFISCEVFVIQNFCKLFALL